MLQWFPLLVGLYHRLAGRPNSTEAGDYRIFTKAFDETVRASDLPLLLPKQTPMQAESFAEAVTRFESGFSGERITFGEAAAELVRELQGHLTEQERAKSIVSFVIDHSGSMRGLRMLSALLAVDAAVDALANAGIDTEILGFTTVNWKGGCARRAWQWAGSPRNPGRLCDIRHIVYSAAGDLVRRPWALRLALHPNLLRENIDGEALQWAGSRLNPRRWDRRVICMISDGVPVDDSTLLANDDKMLLVRHLEATESHLRLLGVVVGFLTIGSERVRNSDLHERAAEPEAAGLSLLRLVRRALIPPAF